MEPLSRLGGRGDLWENEEMSIKKCRPNNEEPSLLTISRFIVGSRLQNFIFSSFFLTRRQTTVSSSVLCWILFNPEDYMDLLKPKCFALECVPKSDTLRWTAVANNKGCQGCGKNRKSVSKGNNNREGHQRATLTPEGLGCSWEVPLPSFPTPAQNRIINIGCRPIWGEPKWPTAG